MKKRFLAVFLSFCMMIGLIPLTVFAGEGGSEEAICSCEEPCKEENVNVDCDVCAGDYTQCLVKTEEDDTEPEIEPLMNDTVIYVSNYGGGDGKSEESTLTFAKAIHKINETPTTGDEELKFVISLTGNIEYITNGSSEGFEKHHTTILGNGHSITTNNIRVSNEGTTLILGNKTDGTNMLTVDAEVDVVDGASLEIYSGVRFENLDDGRNGMQQAFTLSNAAKCTMYGGVITGLHYEPQGIIQINGGSKGGSSFTMYDGEISDCSAGNPSQGFGGAIFMQDNYGGPSKLEIYGGTIKNNKARSGGAVYAGENTKVYIKNAMFDGNEATWGGAVYTDEEAEVSIKKTVFKSNEAIYGGAFVEGKGNKVKIEETLFENNTGSLGGAVLTLGNDGKETTIELSDCTMSGNKAAVNNESGGYGGAIYLQDTKATLSDCVITKNTAEDSGGGVYFAGSRPDCMLLNIKGALQINDNDAPIAKNTYLLNLTPSENPGEGELTEAYQTFLTVADDLNDGDKKANIGVYMDKPGTFTVGYTTYCADIDPAIYFFSDDINYHVEWTEDKTEARLVEGKAEYLIQSEAGDHGTITPEGEVMVEMGQNITFLIAPDNGYKIEDVMVDGVSVGAKESHTFENVTANHTISATFDKKSDGSSSSYGGSYSLDNGYFVRYHNGDDTVRDGEYDHGDRVVIRDDVFAAPSGMELAGWSLEEGEDVDYEAGDVLRMPDHSVDLYAVWEETDEVYHKAYMNGYPDGTFGPERTITRAEAAQLLYGLLDDKTGGYSVYFTDVDNGAWYAEAVKVLSSKGIIAGSNGMFEPDRPVTRAEFAAMAARFAGEDGKGVNVFSDVFADEWYYGAVSCAAQNGWISGYPDGTFRPQNSITRAEAVTIVNKMLGRAPDEYYIYSNRYILNRFTDVSEDFWGYYQIIESAVGHYCRSGGDGENWSATA